MTYLCAATNQLSGKRDVSSYIFIAYEHSKICQRL
jgi:hypothetical protein